MGQIPIDLEKLAVQAGVTQKLVAQVRSPLSWNNKGADLPRRLASSPLREVTLFPAWNLLRWGRKPRPEPARSQLARWLAAEGLSADLRDLDHEVLARFLASPAAQIRPDGRPKKATAANALRSTVRTFGAWVHGAGYVGANPARLVRRARCGAPPPRALSEDEQQRLLNTLAAAEGPEAERDHALFATMLATGIRVGSAVALNVEDVDLDAGVLYLRRAKGDRPERVFLGRRIVEHLAHWVGKRHAGPLFPARGGRLMTTRHANRRLQRWLKAAGIERPASCHSLRHSFARDLYRRCRDVLLVKEALRHRSIVSTLVYAQVDEDRLRRAVGG